MKASLIAAASAAALSLALFAAPPAGAAAQSECQAAGLSGAPLAICSAYVQQDCPAPDMQDRPQCEALRTNFARVSGGQDLDGLLAPGAVEASIPADGGTVTLPGVGSATFPAGAFPDGARVRMSVGVDPIVAAMFE